MIWASDWQTAFVGDDAHRLLGEAAALHAMGLWEAQHVMRFRTHDGKAAWLRITQDGGLQCVAIAPWDDVWTVDSVHVGKFFGGVAWPDTWRTKRASAMDMGPKPLDWSSGWAIGILDDKHTVRLCRVARLDGEGKLAAVEIAEGLECARADHPAVKWWPYDRFGQGVQRLWDSGRTTFHNYHLFAMTAAGEMRKLGLLPKVTRKPRQSSKD